MKRVGSQTTNLFQHLKHHHKAEHKVATANCMNDKPISDEDEDDEVEVVVHDEGAPPPKQAKLPGMFLRGTPYDTTSTRYKDITKAIAEHICKDSLPVYTVEKQGFQNMMKVLDSRYKVPSRTFFRENVIPKLYAETRLKVLTSLSGLDHYSVTTDEWTSITMTPFVSLTIHFISADWTLQSRNLSTAYMPEDPTGSNIASLLEEVLEEWGLKKDSLTAITTDNGSAMIAAVARLSIERVSCFGHILNNAVQNCLKGDMAAENALAACKRLVSSFSFSTKRRRKLEEAQKELGLPLKSLASECPTRWGSKYKMVERVLHNEVALKRAYSTRDLEHFLPTRERFTILEEIKTALEPYADLTDALSADKHVTISCVIPMLELVKDISKPDSNKSIRVNRMQESIKIYMLSRYGYDEDTYKQDPSNGKLQLLGKATLLDHRFKHSLTDEFYEVNDTVYCHRNDRLKQIHFI